MGVYVIDALDVIARDEFGYDNFDELLSNFLETNDDDFGEDIVAVIIQAVEGDLGRSFLWETDIEWDEIAACPVLRVIVVDPETGKCLTVNEERTQMFVTCPLRSTDDVVTFVEYLRCRCASIR